MSTKKNVVCLSEWENMAFDPVTITVVNRVRTGWSFRKMEYMQGLPGRSKCSRMYKGYCAAFREDIAPNGVLTKTGADEYTNSQGAVITTANWGSEDEFELMCEQHLSTEIIVDDTENTVEENPPVITETDYTGVTYNAIVNQESLVVFLSNGEQFTVKDTFSQYEKLRDLVLSNGEVVEIVTMCDLATQVTNKLEKLRYENGRLWFEDIEVSSSMVPRILQTGMQADSEYITALENFFTRLVENPYRTVVDQLYRFLEKNALPITSDGCFLAYKRVRDNYKDVHSGQFDNSVGAVCEVPWTKVDLDQSRTCSYGLHVCSKEYLGSFGGSRVMVCKVDPADVGSVPSDYNNSKMRVRKYEVIGEIGEGFTHEDMDCYFSPDSPQVEPDVWEDSDCCYTEDDDYDCC